MLKIKISNAWIIAALFFSWQKLGFATDHLDASSLSIQVEIPKQEEAEECRGENERLYWDISEAVDIRDFIKRIAIINGRPLHYTNDIRGVVTFISSESGSTLILSKKALNQVFMKALNQLGLCIQDDKKYNGFPRVVKKIIY